VVQTATKVIERCLLMTTDPGDLVLDPTCGSGTTAYVAEKWGRRWITGHPRVAWPGTPAADDGEVRFFALRPLNDDDPAQPDRPLAKRSRSRAGDTAMTLDCETVPHVTLKSSAEFPRSTRFSPGGRAGQLSC
jgi:adenine-specific DNA-methyltransferase